MASASSSRGPSNDGPAGPTGGKVRELKIDEHLLEIVDLETKFETNIKEGLSKEQADQRLAKYGKNQLTPPKQTPEIVKFLKQLAGGFSLLLWFGATLCLLVYTLNCFQMPDPPADNVRHVTMSQG